LRKHREVYVPAYPETHRAQFLSNHIAKTHAPLTIAVQLPVLIVANLESLQLGVDLLGCTEGLL
jgi:hypothetical protein